MFYYFFKNPLKNRYKNNKNVVNIQYRIKWSENMKVAKKTSWKNLPMSEQTEYFTVDIIYDEQQLEIIKKGLIPETMENKWFIYYEDNKLYCHRSWTGYCIFIVEFLDNQIGVIATRDLRIYKTNGIEQDKKNVLEILDILIRRSNL